MKRILGLVVVIGLAAGGSAFAKGNAEAGGGAGAGLETVRLGVMTNSITDYVAAIGLHEGIFEKYGLKVEVTQFAVGINTIDAVTLGQLDIGGGADFAVLNRLGGSQDTPLRIFSGLGDVLGNSWFYTKDPAVQTLKDIEGKAAVVQLGTVYEYYYAKVFEKLGIDPAKVKLLPVESTMEGVALIQNGQASGMWANGQTAAALEKLSGVRTVGILSDYLPSTVHVGNATQKYLEEHQDAVVKYLQATEEIYQFIDADAQRAAEIMYKTNNAPVDISLQVFKTWLNYVDFNQQVFDTMDSILQWANGAGVVKYPYDLRKYVNVEALKAAFPGRGEYK